MAAESDPSPGAGKGKFFAGIVLMLAGGPGIALGSYLRNLAELGCTIGCEYDALDTVIGVLGIVIMVIGILLLWRSGSSIGQTARAVRDAHEGPVTPEPNDDFACTACGAAVNASASKCPRCGAQFEEDSKSTLVSQKASEGGRPLADPMGGSEIDSALAGEADWTIPPQPDGKDFAAALLRAAIATVPTVGGAAVELLNAGASTSVQRRLDLWLKQLAVRVRNLEAGRDGFRRELRRNDAFLSALIQATFSAVKDEQQEKWDALLNAISVAALPGAPERDLQTIVMQHIDRMTPTHMRLLAYFHDPLAWCRRFGIPPGSLAERGTVADAQRVLSELGRDKELVEHITGDLDTSRLIIRETGRQVGDTRYGTTPLGSHVVRFIGTPRELMDRTLPSGTTRRLSRGG